MLTTKEAERETMTRYITLGNGKQIGLSAYAKGWRACKASALGTEFKHGLCTWWSQTREEILQDFMHGLHDRINIRGARVKENL